MPTKNPAVNRACGLRWRQRHPERWQRIRMNSDLKRKHGITLEDYERMLQEQGGVCKICKSTESNNKIRKRFAVDHDHVTGVKRGLLCDRCNRAIGLFRDDVDLVRAAGEYLTSGLT
jgi:hypothetical protein